MALWEIRAVTPPNDPRWLGRRPWRSVVVRAPSSAMARVVAGTLEGHRATGNESDIAHSSFDDEKLYWVKRIDDVALVEADDEDGPDEILAAAPLT